MESVSKINWQRVVIDLDQKGFSQIGKVLTAAECEQARALYSEPNLFRSTINMERYRFGKGEYKYLAYPLPAFLQGLRVSLYEPLAWIANRWMSSLNIDVRYPAKHSDFINECHSKGQVRPTPLILRYENGGYNTLHQDLYGEVYFPFQVVFLLTQKGHDHEGGELVFVEQLPRAQSRAEVVTPDQGEAVIFTTNFRPVKGAKGFYRARMKHGVSPVKSGVRYSMGIIFHDAT